MPRGKPKAKVATVEGGGIESVEVVSSDTEKDRKRGKKLDEHLSKGKSTVEKGPDGRIIVIKPPKFNRATIRIVGTAPYVQHKFSEKALQTMIETQKAGQQARKGKMRQPKNFEEKYQEAMHRAAGEPKTGGGWPGIPASAFRNAMISACRVVAFKMTIAKLSLFVEADGFDNDGTALVRIHGEPQMHLAAARNDNGSTDVRARPMWKKWHAFVRVRWDDDQFGAQDVANLMMRVGMQVGIGEGRADSRNSAGVGWGFFDTPEFAPPAAIAAE